MRERLSADTYERPSKQNLSLFFSYCAKLAEDGWMEDGYKQNQFPLLDDKGEKIFHIGLLSDPKRKKIKYLPIVTVMIEDLPIYEDIDGTEPELVKEINLYYDQSICSQIYLEIPGDENENNNKWPDREIFEQKSEQISNNELSELIDYLKKITKELYESDY